MGLIFAFGIPIYFTVVLMGGSASESLQYGNSDVGLFDEEDCCFFVLFLAFLFFACDVFCCFMFGADPAMLRPVPLPMPMRLRPLPIND